MENNMIVHGAQGKALERARLRTLVADATARFPWYASFLASHGVTTPDQLDDLPPLGQATLERYYYTADQMELPDAEVFATSGTSGGARKRIFYSPEDDDNYVAQRRELFAEFLADIPTKAVAVADLGTGHAAATARKVFTDLGLDARDINFEAPLGEHLEKLTAWQPEVLFTMPMIMDRLMEAAPTPPFKPSRIMVVGDLAPMAWRANVARYFGLDPADVMDVFGSIEMGTIAYSCAETGLYHFHDHIYPEVVSPEMILPEATPRTRGDGVLLLTSTTRRYFPALRFITGDIVAGLQVISYRGRAVHAASRIEGRVNTEYKHGERISSHDICEAMAQVFPGLPFEVADDDGLRIRVAGEVDRTRVEALQATIAEAVPDVGTMVDSGLVNPIKVESVATDSLRSGHGKRRFDLREV